MLDLEILRDKEICIIPHDGVDVDAAISAILLNKLFSHLKIRSRIIIFDKEISEDTNEILNYLGYELYEYIDVFEDESRTLFLVDHYKTSHLGYVVGCIDHHPNQERINYPIYEYKYSCATAYLIFKFIQQFDYPITSDIIELVAHAMMVDTSVFTSTKTIKEEAEEIISYLEEYHLDIETIKKECLCLTNLSLDIKELKINGLKKYDYNSHKVVSSYIQIYNNLELDKLFDILFSITETVVKEKIDMWVFIIFDFGNLTTTVYKISYDLEIEKIEYENILSRGVNIMPEIEKELSGISH